MTMQLDGTRELAVALTGVGRRLQAAGERFVAEGAHRIEAAAKRIVRVRTGTCRRSIHVEGPVSRAGLVEASVGPSVDYAVHLERRYPFMAPAVDEVLPALPDLEIEVIGAELRQLGL
jgi:hypothetical protein